MTTAEKYVTAAYCVVFALVLQDWVMALVTFAVVPFLVMGM